MSKQFVEIEDTTMDALLKVAADNGFESVEKMLTAIAEGFSAGCSVTLLKKSSFKAA